MDRKQRKMQKALEEMTQSYEEEIEKMTEVITNNIFEHHVPPHQALALSPQKMEGMYAKAYQHYQAGDFETAMKGFELLLLLDSDNPRYGFGIAACHHQNKEFEQAMGAYMLTAQKDPANPVPYYHAADCCIEQKDRATAVVMLDRTITLSEGKSEYSIIMERAKVLKDNLLAQLRAEVETKKGLA